jgi:hypothetical protein
MMQRGAVIRISFLTVLLAALALGACGPKTTAISGLPPAQAPQWKPGDFWEFSARSRCPFAAFDRMEVVSTGEEMVLAGGDLARKVRLDKDFGVKQSDGALLSFTVGSGRDGYVFFPLAVGQSRTFEQSTTVKGAVNTYVSVVTVEAAEEITVPAGTFKAFRIRVEKKSGTGWKGSSHLWYAPEAGYFARIVDTHGNVTSLVKYGRK